jgi:hypothetical protein
MFCFKRNEIPGGIAYIIFMVLVTIVYTWHTWHLEHENFVTAFMVEPSVAMNASDRKILQSRINMKIESIRSDREHFQQKLAECEMGTTTGHSQACIIVNQNQISTDSLKLDRAIRAAKFWPWHFSIPAER